MRYDDRMSDFDRIMWVIEKNPLLRSTITAITVLDRTPDRARDMRRVDRASRNIPRMRQRVVWNPYSIAPIQHGLEAVVRAGREPARQRARSRR